MIEIVKKYIDNGFSVLPTKDDKSPATKKWYGVDVDINEFAGAFGIGVKCGNESNGLECMDFDNHFSDAKETLSKYISISEVKEIYEKYNLPIESTQSGGFHLLFRCDKNDGNRKLASRPKWDEKLKRFKPDAIIETRGEGGYFVCAPTHGYKVIRNSILNVPKISIEERDILITNAISLNKWVEPIKNNFEEKDRPGDKYNSDFTAIEDVKSELLLKGWKELKTGIWQRPGKKKGISATLGYVENIFYVFTANGYPFEPEKGYTPFQVIALLKYNGDFSAFAKDLSERYGLNKQTDYTKKTEAKKPEKTKDEWEDILSKSFIDLTIPVEKPPIIMKIGNVINGTNYHQRLLTLGNFSAITGKAKSKKTYLSSLIVSAFVKNSDEQNKFYSHLPENKRMVIRFDTEQSTYDAYVISKLTEKLIGYYAQHYGTFDLREFTPQDRCSIIDFALNKFKDNIGVVIIDGITDLATKINDEEEASKVTGLLMKWTKTYNCHIICIIHQNKNDNYATGHIGSAILKKAETIISAEKMDDHFKSLIKCDNIRGAADFNDFEIEINTNGLPEVVQNDIYNYDFEKEIEI